MPRRYDPFAAWFDAATAANAAVFTVSMRMLGMQRGLERGTLLTDPENFRMVAEKVEAASLGAVEVAAELNRLWWRAATGEGGKPTLASIAADAGRLASAASRPAYKKVRDNASRLRRRKR